MRRIKAMVVWRKSVMNVALMPPTAVYVTTEKSQLALSRAKSAHTSCREQDAGCNNVHARHARNELRTGEDHTATPEDVVDQIQ